MGIILGYLASFKGGKRDIGSEERMGCGKGSDWKERAMLKEDLRQTLAEKLLLNGRMPQFMGEPGEVTGVGERLLLRGEETWWKLVLHAQLGATGELIPGTGDPEVDCKSQCLLLKTGTSEKAQYRWSLILALFNITIGESAVLP
jgi:hypothetical protein